MILQPLPVVDSLLNPRPDAPSLCRTAALQTGHCTRWRGRRRCSCRSSTTKVFIPPDVLCGSALAAP